MPLFAGGTYGFDFGFFTLFLGGFFGICATSVARILPPKQRLEPCGPGGALPECSENVVVLRQNGRRKTIARIGALVSQLLRMMPNYKSAVIALLMRRTHRVSGLTVQELCNWIHKAMPEEPDAVLKSLFKDGYAWQPHGPADLLSPTSSLFPLQRGSE